MDIENVLITDELLVRKSRPINIFAERRALNMVARRMSYGRDAILQTLCELSLDLCLADAAGVSVLYETAEDSGFSWDAMAGTLAAYLGGKAPRHPSPCGTCLELGTTQLFRHPEQCFTWMQHPGFPPIAEGLVVPLYKESRAPFGAIWVVVHDENRHFDREDARIMTVIGQHASAALQIQDQREF